MRKRVISFLIVSVMIVTALSATFIFADNSADAGILVKGTLYTFEEKSDYLIDEAIEKKTIEDEIIGYGKLVVYGDVVSGTKNGVLSYEVKTGNLRICYQYNDDLLVASGYNLHLTEDKGQKVNGEKIGEKIKKGFIQLQISKDMINWTTVKQITDAFEKTPIETDELYNTTDVELVNGCYYKLTVAYKTEIQTGTKKGLFGHEQPVYEYRKQLEEYVFYAYDPMGVSINAPTNGTTYRLGKKIKVEHEGYYKEMDLNSNDVHFGWDIGDFFVSGYTKTENKDGTPVFLKNFGDKVVLWFNLKQNIDKLNGKSDLSILHDDAGYDKVLETPKTDLGRGVLIVRKTDYQNIVQTPVIYTNYLEANTAFGADTKVQLFEEGDYEVSLDYGILNDKIVDKYSYYKISFKFSVRNGNSSVFIRDIQSGNTLPNKAFTNNGFKIDLAGSKYLKVEVKRDIYVTGSDGLTEDTAFNHVSGDGMEYTQEGVYTITVINEYVTAPTTKKIYVGNEGIVKAHVVTGKSISEIQSLVANGATIMDDGTIVIGSQTYAPVEGTEKDITSDADITETNGNTEETGQGTENVVNNKGNNKSLITVIVILLAVLIIAISLGVVLVFKKSKSKRSIEVQK